MLTHHRKPICLSFISLDLPIWSVIETAATVYQKSAEQFHILLTEPLTQEQPSDLFHSPPAPLSVLPTPRLLWLEISPYRVIMTMQGNGRFSYRHFWEQGVYGISRYWLQDDMLCNSGQIRLRNYTRSLHLSQDPLPKNLQVEYELWSDQLQLGRYVLDLEIEQ